MRLRAFQTSDVSGVIALIDGVYREYGDVICLEKADGDLLEIEARYRLRGGEFVVLDDQGTIRGTHAVVPLEAAGVCTFRRLYLDRSLRGGDWGSRLMQWAVDWAIAAGYQRVEFWSDTRFTRAHRFFQRSGFEQDGRVRRMDDGAAPYEEYFFSRDL
ncbi:MAG: GNAT family N-acetyltransferase [Pirellulaceae bacterium]